MNDLVVVVQNIEDQLFEMMQSLRVLKKGLETVEIKDMGEIE